MSDEFVGPFLEGYECLTDAPLELLDQLVGAAVAAVAKGDTSTAKERQEEIRRLMAFFKAHRSGKEAGGFSPRGEEVTAASPAEDKLFEAERLFDQLCNSISCASGDVQAQCFAELTEFVYRMIGARPSA